ncbi:hypothetical protein [Rathayibacter sp. VKM Ac-2760]|uniref:hypothetical protein n=1 Tax=Rathayibacter sp. VKM Ac-2760 TaxID=2609253 RepID=UPI00131928E1|nr:hypothetical protein [Rathayibacter sp. VKM Ac-2760]QHC57531.1 hypothetical protein GSU72_02230 [Rathayibacter sp. VKM Ac-2760]
MDLTDRATDIAFSHCMEKSGFTSSAARMQNDPESRIGDRTYGIWNEDQARLHGYGSAPSAVETAFESDRRKGGQPWQSASDDCLMRPDREVAALKPDNDELTTSLVPRLQTEAYNAASADPAWQAAREAWWQCLRDAGLEPRTGSGEWSSQQGVAVTAAVGADGRSIDKEEEIRVASIEARCNNETALTQTLGDLEASYQAPLIAENQAALNELKTRNQERLAALRDYLARHG